MVVVLMLLLLATAQCYRVQYFDQKVSHFNFREGQVFRQKYLIDDSKFVPGKGAILLYCGNEGPVEMFYNNTGFYNDLVKAEMGGLLLYLEHRYFGESWPFGDKNTSYSKQNLVYLTTEEALMDLASFAKWAKAKWCPDCPVIAFGGSYGGMLACWLRMKYPHLVDMAHCASAPIYYFKGRKTLDYEQFNKIVTNNFALGGEKCVNVPREAFFRLEEFRRRGTVPYATLNSAFRLCTPLTQPQHLSSLEDFMYNGYSYMAMLNYPYPTDFLLKLPGWPANSSCQATRDVALNASDAEFFGAVRAGLQFYYNYSGDKQCFQVFEDTSSDHDMSGWNILACADEAMPMNSDGVNDMFFPGKFDFTSYSDDCQRMFGIRPDYDYAIDHFGGATDDQLRQHSRIFFTNGNLDPWSAGSPSVSLGPDLPACLITDGAHHLDLRPENPLDPPSAKECRRQVLSKLKEWSLAVRNQNTNLRSA